MILLKKLSESIKKIGEAVHERVRVVKMRGLLLILMMSPWLNVWRGKESPCGNRMIKMTIRRMRILTMLMMEKSDVGDYARGGLGSSKGLFGKSEGDWYPQA